MSTSLWGTHFYNVNMLVYDLEIFKNVFVAVFLDIKTEKFHTFEVSPFNDERAKLAEFVTRRITNGKEYVVGYNNKDFDDPLLYYVIKNLGQPVETYKDVANDIIKSKWCPFPIWTVKEVIPNSIDLMQVNNFGKYGKSVSLKQLEFVLRKNSIVDLPYAHDSVIKTKNNINKIIKYCCYDVEVTKDFMVSSKGLIKYRKDFGKLVGIDIITDSEVSLAKKTLTKIFSQEMGITEKEFKYLRTYPKKIVVKDIIRPVDFKLELNQKLLDFYEDIVLEPTLKAVKEGERAINLKNAINYVIEYPNSLKSVYGSGGIHGCVSPGIYEEDDKYELWDWDFGSYYPHLIDRFGLDPAHIPDGLLGKRLITWYKERQSKYPKKTHFTLNYALKIIMNLCYGQMGSEYSPLYDPAAQLGVCVNGMLQITKLSEIVTLLGGSVLYQNTDGILIKILKEDRDKISQAIEDYASSINIPIESVQAKKLILKDVNNFILVDKQDNVKEKGLFETYETIIENHMFNKNTSAKIVSKALKDFFVEGIPVEDTIYNANNIHDFMYGVKGGRQYQMVESSVETSLSSSEDEQHIPRRFTMVENPDGEYSFTLVEQKVDDNMIVSKIHDVRMIRYYAATEGSTLSKLWKEGTKKGVQFDSIEANTPVVVQQSIRKPDINDYLKNGSVKIRYDSDNKIVHRYPNLDRDWYIKKCYEIIYLIHGLDN